MDEFWRQLLTLILAPTLIVGSVSWLLKSSIDQAFQRSLERFKKELERESFEARTKFSVLHERRAQIIADLYGRLARTLPLIEDLVHPVQSAHPPLHEKKLQVRDSFNELASLFFENRLFLPADTAVRVEALITTLRRALIEFYAARPGEKYEPDYTDAWFQTYKSVTDDIPPLLKELETKFREILGSIEVRP